MPELPEVETVRRTLNDRICGLQIVAVDVLQGALRVPVSPDFARRLTGKTVARVARRGKYLVMFMEGTWAWVCHLGMSGKLVFCKETAPRDKHDHIVVRFREGGELRFNDPRRFGLSVVMPEPELESWPSIALLGVEPLGGELDGTYLYELLHRSRRRVRDVLMDQRVIAGLGNIYVNEVLFRARVRPTVRGWRISRQSASDIAVAIPTVLQEAIRWRGTSFSDYRDGNDHRGAFQSRLLVYDRAGESCLVCRGPIKRKSIGNRSTFYCPKCQR
jgi:formamidopyrimidine-DNA glycosylase